MSERLNIALIDVGSNINPELNIKKARELIARQHRLLAASTIVKTAPIGNPSQPDYLNCAWKVATRLDRNAFEVLLKEVEDKLGRQKTLDPSAPRPIDLDLLAWNNQIVHRNFRERDFVRRYTLEIAPELAKTASFSPASGR